MKYYREVFLICVLMLVPLISVLPSQAAVSSLVRIERFVYDGQETVSTAEGDEYVRICNISGGSINLAEDAGGGSNPWRFGEAETMIDTAEVMYELQGTLAIGACFAVASNANAFNSIHGFLPDYEMRPTISNKWTDNASVPNLSKVAGFSGTWGLSNSGDNVTLWQHDGSSSYVQQDEVAYGSTSGDYTTVGLDGSSTISCPGGSPNCAVTRNNVSIDTDKMASDFNTSDNPNAITLAAFTAQSEWSLARLVSSLDSSMFLQPRMAVILALGVAGVCLTIRKRRRPS